MWRHLGHAGKRVGSGALQEGQTTEGEEEQGRVQVSITRRVVRSLRYACWWYRRDDSMDRPCGMADVMAINYFLSSAPTWLL